jgi:hypothetical protein
MKSTTRVGNIGRVFAQGESELMNCIARLSVLYEDFKIEHSELQKIVEAWSSEDVSAEQYRFVYYLRRSFATMNEFRGGLVQLCATREFKNVVLSDLDREYIEHANRYLEKVCKRINAWRNTIGGHFKLSAAEAACRAIPDGTAGSVTWNSWRDRVLALDLQYTDILIAAAVGELLPEGDKVRHLRLELDELLEGYLHVQKATYAIVNHFIWPKLGC